MKDYCHRRYLFMNTLESAAGRILRFGKHHTKARNVVVDE